MLVELDPTLVNGGDCFAHYHSEDRVPRHDTLKGLQSVAERRSVTGDTTLTDSNDFVLVDTSAGNVMITLPRALGGKEYEVTKTSPFNYIAVVPAAGETILGETEVRIFNQWTSIRFKAVAGGWIAI